ncbi:MAG: hypothetical protein R3B81_08160 [bacterium]|nr:hypothetical protein [Gemmatimonadota bacterium]
MSDRDTRASHERAEAIREEHARLRLLLAEMCEECELARLVPLLQQLAEELALHFETEEAEDGFPAVARLQPRFAALMEEVLAEHRAFLDEVGALLRRAELCVVEVKRIHEEAVAVANRLHEHEIKENDLFLEIATTDLGEAD